MPNLEDFEKIFKESFNNKNDYERIKIGAEFAAKLTKVRLDKNMTQNDLAIKSGLKQSAIARIESNGAVPRLDTAIKIANSLDVSLDFLLGSEEKIDDSKKINELINSIQELQSEIFEIKELLKKQKPQILIHYYLPKNTKDDQTSGYNMHDYGHTGIFMPNKYNWSYFEEQNS